MKFLGIFLFLFSWTAHAQEKSFLSSFLPNTMALEASSNRTNVNLRDRDSLSTDNRSAGSFGGDFSRLGNSLSFTTLPRESGEDGQLSFQWVPVFTFAFHNLNFETPSVYLRETDFQVFRTSLGYGPELTWTTIAGSFYGNITPGVAYSWVSWSSPLSGGSMAKSNVNVALTLGYYKYFADNWAVRFFIRQVSEDVGVWKEALTSSQGFEVPAESVSNQIVGLSLCWVFN